MKPTNRAYVVPSRELYSRITAVTSRFPRHQDQTTKHGLHSTRRYASVEQGSSPFNHRYSEVCHDYHDFAAETDSINDSADGQTRVHHRHGHPGGVKIPFPEKLHMMLTSVEEDGLAHIVSWQPHGRCFLVHKPKLFVELVVQRYFRQSKITSFQRQLNLYGFRRLTGPGNDRGAYYHELFLRGKGFLCERMFRTRVKGMGYKKGSTPEEEPDFYAMPSVDDVMNLATDIRSVSSSDNEKDDKRDATFHTMTSPRVIISTRRPAPSPPPDLALSFDDVPEEVTPDLVKRLSDASVNAVGAASQGLGKIDKSFEKRSSFHTTNQTKDTAPGFKFEFERPRSPIRKLVTPPSSPPTSQPTVSLEGSLFPTFCLDDPGPLLFEGQPFHYLDSSSYDVAIDFLAEMDGDFL